MIKYLLIDLDGTITKSDLGITNSVLYALEKMNFDTSNITADDLLEFIGPPLTYTFATLCGFSESETQTAIDFYRENYVVKGMYENELYEGIEEFIKENTKFKLILATSKPEKYSGKILEYFGLDEYFYFITGASLDSSRNTKGKVIKHILDELSIPASECLMIGDRFHDVEGAREHGIDCLGVLYGYGSEDELRVAGAIKIVKSVKEMKKYLEMVK